MDIPMDPTTSPQYLIQFNNGTTKLVPASKMASLIPIPQVSTSNSSHLLPLFLCLHSKIILITKDSFIKGILQNLEQEHIVLGTSPTPTPTRNTQIGVFYCQASRLPGTRRAPMGFYYLATTPAASFGISLLILSAQLTSSVDAPIPFLLHSLPPTPIGTHGFPVFVKRRTALNHKTHTKPRYSTQIPYNSL